jgi:hypothetical protein
MSPPGRDLRLDLFCGLANWAIFLDDIPNNAVARLTTSNFGFAEVAFYRKWSRTLDVSSAAQKHSGTGCRARQGGVT